jgi:hypothetical protein
VLYSPAMLARCVLTSAAFTLALLTLSAPTLAGPAGDGDAERPRRRSVMVWTDPVRDLAPDAVAAVLADNHISKILFVNRCAGGCTIYPGPNDSRANTSQIVGTNRTLSEYSGSKFDEIVACLRDLYGPYNVNIVTEDPGNVFHHEAILAGLPGELGLDDGIGGIAPAACSPLNNVISFSFANLDPDNVEEMCWTLAQESAHSFGLPNHVFDCTDPMTYLGPASGYNCGRKYFRNEFLGCGEFAPGECNCLAKQNSHLELINVFGPGTPPPPPVVSIVSPTADSTVNDGFTVFFYAGATATTRLVGRVELWINGTEYLERSGYGYDKRTDDYNFTAPPLPDGYIDVQIKAFDDIGTEGSQTITVLKGAPCTSKDTCFEHQECTDGRCVYPPAAGKLGDECLFDQYCVEGRCVEHDGQRLCSTSCNPAVSGSCPEGFECVAEGGCFPESTGGCCSVAGGKKRDAFPLIALGLFGLAVVGLRRRRA